MTERPKIFANLMKDVIRPGLCAFCGACAASCPPFSISVQEDAPKLVSRCIACQMCYYSCPRVEFSPETVDEWLFGRRREGDEELIGVYTALYAARSRDEEILKVCQNGGAATSLLLHALEEGVVDGVVCTSSGEKWAPRVCVATSKEELLRCAGTKYSPSPNVFGVRLAVEEYALEKVAIVGVPCHIMGVRKVQMSELRHEAVAEAVKLAVGLFCMGSYGYEDLMKHLGEKGVDPSAVKKFEISGGKFRVYGGEGVLLEEPVKTIAGMYRSGCKVCTDFTAEFSDVSVGNVGTPDDWSTVIVRTKLGEELLRGAEEKGLLEVRPLEEFKPGLEAILKLAKAKKKRGAKAS